MGKCCTCLGAAGGGCRAVRRGSAGAGWGQGGARAGRGQTLLDQSRRGLRTRSRHLGTLLSYCPFAGLLDRVSSYWVYSCVCVGGARGYVRARPGGREQEHGHWGDRRGGWQASVEQAGTRGLRISSSRYTGGGACRGRGRGHGASEGLDGPESFVVAAMDGSVG